MNKLQATLKKIRVKTDELEEAYRELAADYIKNGQNSSAINALYKATKIRNVLRGK